MEIILVDDGSTDNSGMLCDEWTKKDSRIKVIHQENKGVSEARNTGLDIASSEYIGFVDPDDYIHPKMYEILYAEIKKNRADISICEEYAFYEEDEPTDFGASENYKVIVENRARFLSHFLDSHLGPTTWVWNKLFRREILKDKRFIPNIFAEDVPFVVEIGICVECVVWIKEKLYFYRVRQGSISNSKNKKAMLDGSRAVVFWYEHLKDMNDLEYKRALLCKCLNSLAIRWVRVLHGGYREEAKLIRHQFISIYDKEIAIVKNPKEKIKLGLFRYCPQIYSKLKKV